MMSNGTIKKLPEVKDAETIVSDFFRIGACICEKIESGYNSAFTTGSSFSVAPFETHLFQKNGFLSMKRFRTNLKDP